MLGIYAESAVLIISLTLLTGIILWSKWREGKKGYHTRYAWTTDTGKARADKSQPYFTKKCQWKMKQWGLSEAQVLDVLYHGSIVENMGNASKMARKYNGYEIGLIYGRVKRDGHYIIYSTWKQNRR